MTARATSREDWAGQITACWRKGFEAVIESGRLIAAAKEALPHGDFLAMVETDLPFSASTAQRLMAIAADPKITNPAHVQHLPAHWGTLYELTKLNDEQFAAGIDSGKIRPDMERREVINGARAIMGSRQEPDDSLDYFPTPPWATRALVEYVLSPHLGTEPLRTVWEPACGEGHMAEVLAEYFPEALASDIHEYGYGNTGIDFLSGDGLMTAAHWRPDWIITNPPFGDKTEKFVLTALALARIGVAMFVRLQWLESVGRYEAIFKNNPPTIIAFFAERVPICKGRWEPDGTTATAYIWLVWIRGTEPRAPIWIPPGCREALTIPDDVERFTARPVIRKIHHFDKAGKPVNHNPESEEVIDSPLGQRMEA